MGTLEMIRWGINFKTQGIGFLNPFKEDDGKFHFSPPSEDDDGSLEDSMPHISPSELFKKFEEKVGWNEAEMQGTIRVSILSAKGLANSDGMFCGKSDPFVSIFLVPKDGVEEEKARTSTKNGTCDPIWKEVNEFEVDGKFEKIILRLFDEDIGEEDCLGEVQIAAKDIWKERTVKGPEEVQDSPPKEGQQSCGQVSGSLDFIIQYIPPKVDGTLSIVIDSASGVKGHDFGGSLGDPTAYIMLDDNICGKTGTQKNTTEPVWKEGFEFHVAGEYTNLFFSVWDDDTGKDDYISHFKLPVSRLIREKEISGTFDLFCQEDADDEPKPMGNLTLSVKWSPPELNGTIEVTVEGAADLVNKDSGIMGDANDAMCTVFLDEERIGATKTLQDTNSPQWGESFSAEVTGVHQTLQLVVWDTDQLFGVETSGNDALGCVKISAQQLSKEKTVELTQVLCSYKGSYASGSLTFKVVYTPN